MKGAQNQEDFVVYSSPPVDVGVFLFYDAMGMYYDRLWPNSIISIQFLMLSNLPKKKEQIKDACITAFPNTVLDHAPMISILGHVEIVAFQEEEESLKV